MPRKSVHYYQQKKKRHRQNKINKFCFTTLVSILSITSILYLFLIVDKLTETSNLKDVLKEITTLQSTVSSLEGKHDRIVKIIESNEKLKKSNEKLNKNIKKYQNNIEELEIKISKMEK